MAAILGILPFENAKKDIMKIVVIWWLYGGEQWSSNLFDPYASHVSDCWKSVKPDHRCHHAHITQATLTTLATQHTAHAHMHTPHCRITKWNYTNRKTNGFSNSGFKRITGHPPIRGMKLNESEDWISVAEFDECCLSVWM